MTTARTIITVEDLMDADAWVEVINGAWVPMDTDTMGFEHTTIITNLYDLLRPHVRANDLGFVHGDGLKYILHEDARGVQTARTPDVAFLRRGSLPDDFDRRRPIQGAPTLAVEVASPGQTLATLLAKVTDFLRYDSEEVWLIYPTRRELHRYQRDAQTPRTYTAADTLDAAPLLPGLTITIADIFADPLA